MRYRSIGLLPAGAIYVWLLRGAESVLRRLGSVKILLMFGKDLAGPLPDYRPGVKLTVEPAGEQDMDELAAIVEADDPSLADEMAGFYRQRLEGGSICFVARVDGVIVGSNWIRVRTAVGADDLRMFFGSDEIYTTDAFTAPDWRGKGIHPALNHALLAFAQRQGYRRAYTMVLAENDQSLRTMPRFGWEHTGTILFFRPLGSKANSIWHVAGDPYPMPVGRRKRAPSGLRIELAKPPLQASTSFDLRLYGQRQPVSMQPWARSYRLANEKEQVWLKIVPIEMAACLQANAVLANEFPRDVPRVISYDDQDLGRVVTCSHGGSELSWASPTEDLVVMVETYARLQSAALARSNLLACLPAPDLTRLVPELFNFLRSDGDKRDIHYRVGAEAFIGIERTEALRSDFLAVRQPLADLLQLAMHLPSTLNHGALEPGHAARTQDGRVVLFNWVHVCRGPAGLSLHRLFGGSRVAASLLQLEPTGQQNLSALQQLMSRYFAALVDGKYADECQLRHCLLASIVAGELLDLLQCGDFPRQDDDERAAVALQLQTGLSGLLQLVRECAPRHDVTDKPA